MQYAINDALDRRDMRALASAKGSAYVRLAIRNRKIKSRTFLGEKSAKNNEEIKSTSNQDTRFDLIGLVLINAIHCLPVFASRSTTVINY